MLEYTNDARCLPPTKLQPCYELGTTAERPSNHHATPLLSPYYGSVSLPGMIGDIHCYLGVNSMCMQAKGYKNLSYPEES